MVYVIVETIIQVLIALATLIGYIVAYKLIEPTAVTADTDEPSSTTKVVELTGEQI